jgi:hypothetical protein
VSAPSGCIPLTRYALSKLRAMGPYGFIVYGALLRLCPEYGTPFTTSHKELVEMSGTSYQTLRKALGMLSDLDLAVFSGGKVNGRDSAGLSVTLHRTGCGFACENPCSQPVDNSVDKVDTPESAVSWEDTVESEVLARAKKKAQVEGSAVTPGVTVGHAAKNGGLKELHGVDLDDLPVKKTRKRAPAKVRDDRLDRIFEFWKSYEFQGKHLTQHLAMTPVMEKAITKALETLDMSRSSEESLTELEHAIANFGVCLLDPKSQWTYRWTLADFMQRARGYERFLDEADPIEREMHANGKKSGLSARNFKSGRPNAYAGL